MSKALIEGYTAELKARNQSVKSINAYRQLLTDLETIAPLETYTKDNLIKYFNNLTTRSSITKKNGKLAQPPVKPQASTIQLKQKLSQKFFRDQGRPEVIAWIKNRKLPEKLKDTDILTDSEVNLLIETAKTYYSKALIAFLYDTGCRINEAMKLTYADLHQIKDVGVVVHIPTSKTAAGYRKTVLTYSDVLIRNLETYTERKQSDKIFCQSYSNNARLIKETAREARLEKKVTAHRFRHAHATELVRNGTQEAVIRKELGWSATSPMIARYQHLNDDDVINSKLEKAGKKKPEDKPQAEIRQPEAVNVITQAKKLSRVEEENRQLREQLAEQQQQNEKRDADYENLKKDMELTKEFFELMRHDPRLFDLMKGLSPAQG